MASNQLQQFNKEQLHDWRKFWTSELGKITIDRYKNYADEMVHHAMLSDRADLCAIYVNRAAGAVAIIDDIEAGLNAADEADKEAKESESKKG